MGEILISDGIVRAIVTDEAEAIFENGNIELFKSYYDESEALIESAEELDKAIFLGYNIFIEVGSHEELLTDYQEAQERNKESRSFEGWIEAKVELLIEN